MANIILITGGQRSGKSSYAQRLAMELAASKNRLPIYLATSRVWDEEHRKRIERHKLERQENWVNIEEEKYLSNHQFIDDDVVVIDCVTLWATNFFFDNNGDVDLSFQELCKEFESFSLNNCTLIFVTNEIGLGGVSQDNTQRRFTDLQGYINQTIASKATSLFIMISGIPLRVK